MFTFSPTPLTHVFGNHNNYYPFLLLNMPSTYTCSICYITFTEKAKYIHHKRHCTGDVIMFHHAPSSGVITVFKDANGFTCHCSDMACSDGNKSFKNKFTLKRHLNDKYRIWIGPGLVKDKVENLFLLSKFVLKLISFTAI